VKALTEEIEPEAFFTRLREAPSRVLLLDYDGTLAPFRVERDQAVPYPELLGPLIDLQRDGRTRVVVVSGRAVDNLRPLLGLNPTPELWGTHGWERQRPGRPVELRDPGAGPREALARAKDLADPILGAERVEEKPAAVAAHVRGLSAADAEARLRAVRGLWSPLLQAGGLELLEFDGGVELRVGGRNKGSVVDDVLAEEPEGAAVAYLGDDRTDEDAFRALAGRGLAVLVRGELRPTAAQLWLKPPGELVDFLRRWRGALAPAGPGAAPSSLD
jgi:trehalose-phosphatase